MEFNIEGLPLATTETEEFICEECRQIDFQKVVDLDPAEWTDEERLLGYFIADLGTRCNTSLDISGIRCGLCKFFALAATEPDRTPMCLRAHAILDIIPWLSVPTWYEQFLSEEIQIYLQAGEHDFRKRRIFCLKENDKRGRVFSPRIPASFFDQSLVKQWVDYCINNHTELCCHIGARVDSLKVIDCVSFTVVPAPSTDPYLALSYVWGKSKATSQNHSSLDKSGHSLPSPLPPTIRDAITVTKVLGYSYLWVDKYCIDQTNEREKQHMISRMDDIYKGAAITIIAAAGEDEDYGLVGVSSSRTSQPPLQLGEYVLINTLPDPHLIIQESKWSTRGWTYQEAALSQRRLVFTSDQVYFECNAMNLWEGFVPDLDRLHSPDRSKALITFSTGVFSALDLLGSVESTESEFFWNKYRAHVMKYSSKELSYEEDCLRAFFGIARHMQTSATPVYHLWGLPFISSLSETDSEPSNLTEKSFLFNLSWWHPESSRNKSIPIHRRPEFPSWSWVGWSGRIAWWSGQLDRFIPHVSMNSPGLDAVADSNREGSGNTLFQDEESRWLHSPRVLELEALVCMSGNSPTHRFCEPWALVDLSQDLKDPESLDEAWSQQKILLLLIGEDINLMTIMMIVENRDECVSRLGIMRHRSSFDQLQKTLRFEKRRVKLI